MSINGILAYPIGSCGPCCTGVSMLVKTEHGVEEVTGAGLPSNASVINIKELIKNVNNLIVDGNYYSDGTTILLKYLIDENKKLKEQLATCQGNFKDVMAMLQVAGKNGVKEDELKIDEAKVNETKVNETK